MCKKKWKKKDNSLIYNNYLSQNERSIFYKMFFTEKKTRKKQKKNKKDFSVLFIQTWLDFMTNYSILLQWDGFKKYEENK